MIRTISFRDTYKDYRRISKMQTKHDIGTYCKVLSLFMEKVVERLKERGEVGLPEALGKIVITGKQVKPTIDEEGNLRGLAPDWKRTKELWQSNPELKGQIVYHTNDATSGVRYKMHWDISKIILQNKFLYTFVAARHLKRDVSKLIQEGKEYTIKV